MLVLTMLLTASFSGFWGLSSYSNLINELDFSLRHAPQKNELVSSTAVLSEPLIGQLSWPDSNDFANPSRQLAARQALGAFLQRIEVTRKIHHQFYRKTEDFPAPIAVDGQISIVMTSLSRLESKLNELEYETERILSQPKIEQTDLGRLLKGTGQSVEITRTMLDPSNGLAIALRDARGDYESTFTMLWTTSALATILFLGLIRYGYVHVFRPIRRLYEGARRVAQGDFDYRIPVATQDEMGELAESFNMMTDRFQDIADDLDRQVDERSRQLVRSDRLAAVGFLAAGVAHEINNPLAAISMASESLEDRLRELLECYPHDDRDVIIDYLEMMQRESFRCREITLKLRDFSREGESPREVLDVAQLVEEVISMVQHLSQYREMQIDYQSTAACHLEINGTEIKQVILNLVANGLDSMDPGGKLSIEIIEKMDEVRLVFRDEGCGMTPEVREHLFEPFFTSRKVGRGTGLGLSISHRIISDHGGTIEAHSEGPGLGSTFSIRLPRRVTSGVVAA